MGALLNMYTQINKSKFEILFNSIEKKIAEIINNYHLTPFAAKEINSYLSSELKIRGRTFLNDMLFDLNEKTLDEVFSGDFEKQNKFIELNLRKEIIDKFAFNPSNSFEYSRLSKKIRALIVGGATFVTGTLLMSQITPVSDADTELLSKINPISMTAIIAFSLGAALVDSLFIEPLFNSNKFKTALSLYLLQTKKDFLAWFDEIELYYNNRVSEIIKNL